MTLENTQKLAKHIMRLLKVRSVSFPVAITDKGPLSIKYYEQGDYEMVLDAVPLTTADMLTDENNIELRAVLEKYHFEKFLSYMPDSNQISPIKHQARVDFTDFKGLDTLPKKKIGRPIGSKNGNTKTKKGS